MPLVIFVLVLIVAICWSNDTIKNATKTSAQATLDMRKTNARLEHKTLDNYMKHGYSFNEAFSKTCEYMVANGFEPCIPRQAYTKNTDGVESSYCEKPEQYDSFLVRQRRSTAEIVWRNSHPKALYPDEIYKDIYKNFPTNYGQYVNDLENQSFEIRIIPVGSYVTHPNYGTCEVLEHRHTQGTRFGYYVLKVVRTGQIITHVRIDDKRLLRVR